MAVNLQIMGAQLKHIYPRKLDALKTKFTLNENDKIISNKLRISRNLFCKCGRWNWKELCSLRKHAHAIYSDFFKAVKMTIFS